MVHGSARSGFEIIIEYLFQQSVRQREGSCAIRNINLGELHLRETRTIKRGQSLFGACHAVGGFAEIFVLEFAFEGFGPEELDLACGIDEWKVDGYDTDASDDHQYGAGTSSENDMDVAADNDEEEDESDCPADGNCACGCSRLQERIQQIFDTAKIDTKED